jgi:hypothetical protein
LSVAVVNSIKIDKKINHKFNCGFQVKTSDHIPERYNTAL